MKEPEWWFPDEYVRAGRDWANLLQVLSLGLCLLTVGIAIVFLTYLFAGAMGWANGNENAAREVAGMGNWTTEEPPAWALSFVKTGKVASLIVVIVAVAIVVIALAEFLWPRKVAKPPPSDRKRRGRPRNIKGGAE